MTKRFTYVKNNSITQYQALPIQEIGKGKAFHCQGIVDKLNKLTDENEQLKQFKENVIKWVDSQMKFNAKEYIETEDSHFKNENIDLHNFKVFIGIDSDD